MSSFFDSEFGNITVRKSRLAKTMKASVAPSGELRISLPAYLPVFMAKRMVSSSRSQIRALFNHVPTLVLTDGMSIGKAHTLHIRTGPTYSVKRIQQQLVVTVENLSDASKPEVVQHVRAKIITLLRLEAKQHLPGRLAHAANTYGFTYHKAAFSHASSRWGSCSSRGTITLNIALMNLPFELIDYVLVHELAHTVHMNHSQEFWKAVEACDPHYKKHRQMLKQYTPHI